MRLLCFIQQFQAYGRTHQFLYSVSCLSYCYFSFLCAASMEIHTFLCSNLIPSTLCSPFQVCIYLDSLMFRGTSSFRPIFHWYMGTVRLVPMPGRFYDKESEIPLLASVLPERHMVFHPWDCFARILVPPEMTEISCCFRTLFFNRTLSVYFDLSELFVPPLSESSWDDGLFRFILFWHTSFDHRWVLSFSFILV